ncbi:unnamed protein product, partial [Medioppia subpectinata]
MKRMVSNQPQYRLKWNSFHSNLSEVFRTMLVNENLVDCTVACDGASIKAHKMVLAASSTYFQNLFIANPCKHPIVILKDVRFADLQSIIDFIYTGEVNVPQDQLSSLLKTAETLRIKGLTEVADKESKSQHLVQSIAMKTKKRKRKRNKSQNNNENVYSSEEEERITSEDIEPIKLLEQSMSTPENSRLECAIDGSLATSETNLDLEDGEDNELQEIPLMDENCSQDNFNQFKGYSIDNHLRVGLNSNCAAPQTIEEYEQLLSEIQCNNLTTCPVCAKVFIKKSKLIRHYHTHF